MRFLIQHLSNTEYTSLFSTSATLNTFPYSAPQQHWIHFLIQHFRHTEYTSLFSTSATLNTLPYSAPQQHWIHFLIQHLSKIEYTSLFSTSATLNTFLFSASATLNTLPRSAPQRHWITFLSIRQFKKRLVWIFYEYFTLAIDTILCWRLKRFLPMAREAAWNSWNSRVQFLILAGGLAFGIIFIAFLFILIKVGAFISDANCYILILIADIAGIYF